MVSETHLSVGSFASFKFRWMTDFITRLTRVCSYSSKAFRKRFNLVVWVPRVSKDHRRFRCGSSGDEGAIQRHGLDCGAAIREEPLPKGEKWQPGYQWYGRSKWQCSGNMPSAKYRGKWPNPGIVAMRRKDRCLVDHGFMLERGH